MRFEIDHDHKYGMNPRAIKIMYYSLIFLNLFVWITALLKLPIVIGF
jgi:hypothetical protein